MIRVLQVLGSTTLGGAESRVMDIYRHMDRDRVQFDFLVTKGHTGHFDAEIESLGGHVYTLPPYRFYNHKQYTDAVKTFFEEHKGYMAVHGHMTSTASIYLPIAKKSGVPLTISHARSAGVDKGIKGYLTNWLRRKLPKKCDRMFACSDLAAEAVFGKDEYANGHVKIMPNAIDVGDYAVNEKSREAIREEWKLNNRFVVGHVGRLHGAKNHEFLIKIFAEFLSLRRDAVLMIVGEGPLRANIEGWIIEADSKYNYGDGIKLKDRIIMTGNQSPVAPFYQAFDTFLFPSLYEGMPGTVVEAQAAGLKSLISDSITRQVKITDIVEFDSLSRDAKQWAEKLYSMYGDLPIDSIQKDREHDNDSIQQLMKDTDYDVNNQVKYYMALYEGENINF